uniref:Uncharacterized protein n=1 Tax=Romanomermis culicivorax TaxID=13658 RepID=A0A915HXJ5_ROMCU
MASAESTTPHNTSNWKLSTVQNASNVENAAARAKNDMKKLLIENRLNVDDEVRITDQSDANFFKLIIKTKRFSTKDFTIEIVMHRIFLCRRAPLPPTP